jgi:ABC-2 type transport system permease protein
MLPIAIAELKMLLRNRLVALCALVIPLVFGAIFLFNDVSGAAAAIASVQITAMAGLGVYVTATTTLAGRRQTLFLKRLRSGAIGDRSILAGLVLPIVLVNVVQIAAILAVLVVNGDTPPAQPALLVAALLGTEAMFVGFALATAGVTNSPEHAQFTTLPIFFATFGIAMWVGFTGFADLGWLKRVLPGGGTVDLISAAWSGQVGGVLPSALGMLAWAFVALLAARAMFRWEPRV